MQAKNGFALPLRSRGGLIACCAAIVCMLASAVAASPAGATTLKPTAYVAVGDSLSFGYTEQKFYENLAKFEKGETSEPEPANTFENGFTNAIEKVKAAKEAKLAKNALSLVDLACPGEVSDGLIGHNEALGGGAAAEFNPCGWHNEDGFPTHVPFGSVSQLEAAIGAVTSATVPVKLVTLQIGSNDELHVVGLCENKTYDEENGFKGGLDECLVVEAGEGGHYYKGGLFAHIITNTGDVIGVLRHEGYTGKVGLLGFYNPQAIVLPGSDALQKKLNETFEAEIAKEAFGPGVVYGNPFPIINPQKGTKVEQEAICKYTEFCNEFDKKINLEKETGKPATAEEAAAYPLGDIHPTPAGYQQLAKVLEKKLGLIK